MQRFFLSILAISVATCALDASARAAVIVFGTPNNISAPTDVTLGGQTTLDRAYYFGAAAAAGGSSNNPNLVINGITFTNFDTQLTDTKTNLVHIQSNTYGTDGQSGDYADLLQSADWLDDSPPATLTFNDLVPGASYSIGVWVNDDRQPSCCGGTRDLNVSGDGGTNSADLTFDGTNGIPGQFVYGTFTADPSGSQTLNLDLPPNIGSNNEQINGVVLSYTPLVVPEPASIALFGLGAVGLFVAARRRKGLIFR